MFDPKTDLSNNHVHSFNPPAPINESWGTMNLDDRVRTTARNYENYRNYKGGGSQLRAEDIEEQSSVSSPPLLKNNYRHLSPKSRSRAIARGQLELMEMVKTMPESCYELSLKDIVEKHQIKVESEEECLIDGRILGRKTGMGSKRQDSSKKRNDSSKANIVRNRSVENRGLLLKMAFPFSLRSKKKNLATNSFSRVSPRPEGLDRSGKCVEKEWWKKRFSGSRESESGGVSGSSGRRRSSSSSFISTLIRRKSGCSLGCWPFITSKKTPK